MGITYLACPYTHANSSICNARYNIVTYIAAKMVLQDVIVFSPITMTHPFDRIIAEPGQTLGSDYWVRFDIAFMAACSDIVIVRLPGWEESSGIRREIEYFKNADKPVKYVDPEEYGIDFTDDEYCAAWK